MSLLDQSQQLFPTSVVVTVHQARNLRTKGKNGTNDAYAIMQVAKDKFSTSVAEKCVAPVWKEEATFDLPLFHPGNAERCTLYVVVMHRAQVGLDKFLGQAVVNLLGLHDDKAREKTDWFKLVDKSGKEDKVRGEVLLDIKFLRNNMSASMFDLSLQDKPRSRISKLKDKVRGKKKEGSSDSVSAIVHPVSQVLTDSEEEADALSLNPSIGGKKKSKFKNLFGPKTNLQRNISQSMSTLPEKNSSLSSSRSSGLNVDPSEGQKKFKLLGHKRTGSSDSKVSLGPFSLLGRNKQQSNSELNNLCINGSHVYTEDADAKSGSTLSLNSSGRGSVEDVHRQTSDASADVNRSAPVPSHGNEAADRALLEQQRHQEEEERRQAEAKRLQEEEKYRAEAARLQEEEQRRQQEEQERRRRFLEDEAKRRKQEEEERRNEEERRRQEAADNQRLAEERRQAEEQKHQEEASMSDRLSSLFGMIRKKEEKKEEVQQQSRDEQPPAAAPHTDFPVSSSTTDPFQDVPLRSDPPPASSDSPSDPMRFGRNPPAPSAVVFQSRTAKVSAVKPRLPQILESEAADCQSPSQPCPSPDHFESTLSSVSSESPDTFSSLHSSLAPPNLSPDPSGSPRGSTEDLSVDCEGSSPTMADPRRRAIPPPSYSGHRTQSGENQFNNPAYVEDDGSQQRKVSLPPPDYDVLFPKKRHGVQGQTKWDNLLSELSKKNTDGTPELLGPEMSVDGPEEPPGPRLQENPDIRKYRETKPVSSKKVAAPAPPGYTGPQAPPAVAEAGHRHGQKISPHSLLRSSSPAVPSSAKTSSTSSGTSYDGAPTPTPRPSSRPAADPADERRKSQVDSNREAPTARPRQRASGTQPAKQEDSAAKASVQTVSSSNMSRSYKEEKDNSALSDQFSSTERPSQKAADPFANSNGSDSVKQGESRKKDERSTPSSPAFQRRNSSRKKILPPAIRSESIFSPQPQPKEATASPAASHVVSARGVAAASVPPQAESDLNPERGSYGEEDASPTEPPPGNAALPSSQPLPVLVEEAATQAEHLSGGKPLLKAWVSPSEAQPVSTQSNGGGGLGLSPRRPHAVKPLSSADSQPSSSPAGKDPRVWDTTPGKIKVDETVGSAPYSQLTTEELVKLVAKQQTDLSKKDAKITELEEYIDNLLVRVIEEKPTILQSLTLTKPV
uniref:Apoptosis-stimulating of p53 protein 1 n=1 Tax=Fundulus heteroclitus TaxID=8078 RepID=A0A147AAM1_FUNHE